MYSFLIFSYNILSHIYLYLKTDKLEKNDTNIYNNISSTNNDQQRASNEQQTRMEYSVYYYHSNSYTKVFAFIKDKDLIEVNASYVSDAFEEGFNYNNFKFILSIEEIKSSKKIYEYYLLSLLLTEDIHKLTYCDDTRDFMGFTKNVWRFSFKKNWKGLYFTEKYGNNYGLEVYPETGSLSIDEGNEERKTYGKDLIEYNEMFVPDYLSTYIEIEIQNIKKELLKIEKDVYVQKRLVLFSSKIQQFINDDTLLYLNNILLK